MMKSLIASAALALLVSCAETPSKPTTSGGSSSGSGKVVTATPEDPYECDDDLILEPHLPEECIPPEPPEPVVQKPVEPPKPDPIVGTYKNFRTKPSVLVNVFRVYQDNGAGFGSRIDYRWERDGNVYRFFPKGGGREKQRFVLKYQSIRGEPNILTVPDANSSWQDLTTEGLKLSDNPKYQFDLYQVQCRGRCEIQRKDAKGNYLYQPKPKNGWRLKQLDPLPGWKCFNVGRRLNDERTYWSAYGYYRDAPITADSLAECEAICEQALLNRFETVGEGNCSDYEP